MRCLYFFILLVLAWQGVAGANTQNTQTPKDVVASFRDVWRLDFTGFDFNPQNWNTTLQTRVMQSLVTTGYGWAMFHSLPGLPIGFVAAFGFVNLSWILVIAFLFAMNGYAKKHMLYLVGGGAAAYYLMWQKQ